MLRLALAVVLGLVACELALRVAGAGYLWLSGGGLRGGAERAEVPGLTLVCLGDSNTFGLRVAAEESYPAQLEALLQERVPDGPHRVLNLGVPGSNSRQLLAVLDESLQRDGPDAVLVTVGVNNPWSWMPDSRLERPEPPWYAELRLYKLARILGQRLSAGTPERPAGPVLEGTDRDGRPYRLQDPPEGEAPTEERALAGLADDLGRMRAAAEAAGVPLFVLTYGSESWDYGRVNAALRGAAAELGLPLFDCAAAFAEHESELGFHRLFPYDRDPHPGPLGYRLVARVAYQGLVAEGFLAGEPLESLAPAAVGGEPPLAVAGKLDAAPDGPEALRLLLGGGDPGYPFVVLVSGRRSRPRASFGGRTLPLGDGPLLAASLQTPSLRGTFDGDGRARCELAELLPAPGEREALRGRVLSAAYVVLEDADDPEVRWVSEAVRFTLR